MGHRHDGPFVGRGRELARLRAGLDDAIAGAGSVYLIIGDAGIGKSRLADEFATSAAAVEAQVLWGRCWESGGAPAYWPWVQAVRSYLREQESSDSPLELGPEAVHVAQIVPEMRSFVSEGPVAPASDAAGDRFRSFDAMATFLRGLSRRRPLVLILDDLHVADASSLLLLRFLAGEINDSNMMVVGLGRDEGVLERDAAGAILAEIARIPGTHRLELTGLSVEDFGDLVRAMAQRDTSDPAWIADLHDETEGNPLFLTEVLRLASTDRGGAADIRARPIPPVVRDVIGHRVDQLAPEAVSVLTSASVLGREFTIEALRRLAGVANEYLLGILDEAIAASIISDVPGAVGRFRFAHALIRDVLYERLPTARRLELHRRAGEVLEALYAEDIEPHLAELAYHFVEASPAGDASIAIGYARRAGERAATVLAYEEAARLFGEALQLWDLGGSRDRELRCDLLLGRGGAQMRAGETAEAQRNLLEAATIAKAMRSPDRLARAALGYGGSFAWGRAAGDAYTVPLLRDALQSIGEDEGSIRARLLARLAGALRDQPTREPRASLSREAVEMARSLQDRATLAYTLEARFESIWWPENAAERLDLASELLQLSEELGDQEQAFDAHAKRHIAYTELGLMPAADQELSSMQRIATGLRQPACLWQVSAFGAMRAILAGRFDEAEWMIRDAEASGAGSQGDDPRVSSRIQRYLLGELRGSLAVSTDLVGSVRSWIDEHPTRAVFRCLAPHAAAVAGRRAEAAALFQTIARDDFGGIPADNDYLLGLCLVSDVCVFLRDAPHAETLVRALQPHASRIAVDVPEGSVGSVSRSIGILNTLLARYDDAATAFETALETNAAIGSPPWFARSQHDYARVLLVRAGPGDVDRARSLLVEAEDIARDLGMAELARQVGADLGALGSAASRPVLQGETLVVASGVFRREGDYWSIAFDHDVFRLKDSKGLNYLSRLLRDPDREVLALELVTTPGSGRAEPASGGTLGSGVHPVTERGDPMLDEAGKRAYRERIADLRQDADDADRDHDIERAARAREELDFIAAELTRATGLGGRDRRTPSETERARVSVTKAIKTAIRHIEPYSPGLARHLDVTVRTGTFCIYAPDPRVPVTWQV
jgi:tetratricopeptide (TPR) repeat protein